MNPWIFINSLRIVSAWWIFGHLHPSGFISALHVWIVQTNHESKAPCFFCRYYIPFRVSILSWSQGTKDTRFEQYRKCSSNNNNNNRPFFLNQVFYLDIIFRLPFPSCKPTLFNEKKTQPFTAKKIFSQTRLCANTNPSTFTWCGARAAWWGREIVGKGGYI